MTERSPGMFSAGVPLVAAAEIQGPNGSALLVRITETGISLFSAVPLEPDQLTKLADFCGIRMTVPKTGGVYVAGGSKKHRRIRCTNTTTADDLNHRMGPKRIPLIRMIRECTKHLGPLGDGVVLGVPSASATAEYTVNAQYAQFGQCLMTILKQIKGTMEADLESMLSCLKTQGTSCDKIDATVTCTRPDDNSLKTPAACLFDLCNGLLETSPFGQEVRKLEAVRHERGTRSDQSVDLGTPPHRFEKTRHQCTRCSPTLLMEIAAELEPVDQHR